MDNHNDGDLQRTSSHTSTKSNRSHRSLNVRAKSRKHSSAVSTAQTTPTTAHTEKSLTSFPSLSPENSPVATSDGKPHSKIRTMSDTQTPRKSAKNKPSIVDSLTTNSPSFRGRSALFNDSPTSPDQHVPGALNHASDEHIRRLVSRTGVVALVRQMAEDLAQRDAEMTNIRLRAEARERELKRMLREVEVSNLDIERRLHHIDNPTEVHTKGVGNRLGQVVKEGSKDEHAETSNGIHEMVGEAMDDKLTQGNSEEVIEDYKDALARHERQSTIKATGIANPDGDGVSTSSSSGFPNMSKLTTKGWKDYLWSGTGTSRKTSQASSTLTDQDGGAESFTRSRTASGATSKRKGLNADLFQPPKTLLHTKNGDALQAVGDQMDRSSARSRGSSMTSWTVKLFAGNPQAGREADGENSVRDRSVTSGSGKPSRKGSMASMQTSTSARASLLKISGMTLANQPIRKTFQPLGLGPNGTVKGSSQSSHSVPPGSPASIDTGHNLGPVEMDTILPYDSKPPTLTPYQNNLDASAEFLTDRFGFIYDNRRRKKEAEATSRTGNGVSNKEMLSNARDMSDTDARSDQNSVRPDTPASTDHRSEEKPTKKWQDYLKIATFPTELLSHTPSSSTVLTLANSEIKKSLKRSPTFGDTDEVAPVSSPNPQPSASSITAGKAEISKPSMSTSASPLIPMHADVEPVKLLLAQLTELHDSLQRDKTVKWNEFLRKVRAERRKEDESAAASDTRSQKADTPEVNIADGEIIGIATLGNKGRIGRAKYKEFKSLVLAGIPVAHRAKIWAECSGASALRVPSYYEDLVKNGVDDPIILAQIQMDINRTLTDNVFFRKGPGVAKLNEILLAYSRRNPEVGYCQGMNLITASLLLIMPTAEDAFWVLVSMIENILPRHYYDNSLLTSRADQQVLRQYVAELLPRLSAHLDALGIELEALTFQWFLSLFTDCLSAEALYRVWDVLLCCKDEDGNGGSTFLFQVALALLKLNEAQLIACETPGEVYSYLGGEITNHAISIDGLIRASEGLKGLVKRGDVEERRAKWVAIERETVLEREKIRKSSQILRSRRGKSPGTEAETDSEDDGHLQAQSPMPIME